MKFIQNRPRFFLISIILVCLLLFIFMAPAGNKLTYGSTYNRSPNGYGAWYAYMNKQGVGVNRWQKPLEELGLNNQKNLTLLRVNLGLRKRLNKTEEDWISKGNRLILLGMKQSATGASFSSLLNSQVGAVKIETTRRLKSVEENKIVCRLEDLFGCVVWQETIGKGELIAAVTPELAANAYQDEAGNYQFLSQLMRERNLPMFVDEYIHGYRDKSPQQTAAEEDWLSYLLKTPLAIAFFQALVILLVTILARSRRFGKPQNLPTVTVNNSQAYIEGMAGVLEKAKVSDFVLEMLTKEEQLKLQKNLGLGSQLLPVEEVVAAWQKKTRQPTQDLRSLLSTKGKIDDQKLKSWLSKWQSIHQSLTKE